MSEIIIREIRPEDRPDAWSIFHEVVNSGDTYIYPEDTPESYMDVFLYDSQIPAVYVAEKEGNILGLYRIRPNFMGRASHIANASYMVHPDYQGQGIGAQLCEHSLTRAKELGFTAMQFNIVVSTNTNAVKLWQRFGFEIIATVPQGFQHKTLGRVDAHIMYRDL